jgi:hypothetical protein
MIFTTFNPSYYAARRAEVSDIQDESMKSDRIRAIAEAELNSAQAEVQLITGQYQRVIAKAKVQAVKLAKKYEQNKGAAK